MKRDHAFVGLVSCGTCGGAITADTKKERYVYYHCAAKCEGVSYVREHELAEMLGEPLKSIRLTPEMVEWTRQALLDSHADETQHRETELKRLAAQRRTIEGYLDKAYEDRLSGLIDPDMWTRKSGQWKAQLEQIDAEIAGHGKAHRSYITEGVRLIELAERAYDLYRRQKPKEQRQILDVVLSNCVLKGRSVRYGLRKPFDIMADMARSQEWRGRVDAYRTLCLAPPAEVISLFERAGKLLR